jgi:hypothetical protein
VAHRGRLDRPIVVAFVLVAAVLGNNLTSDGNVTNDPESLRANDLQSERFPHLLHERRPESSVTRAARDDVPDLVG